MIKGGIEPVIPEAEQAYNDLLVGCRYCYVHSLDVDAYLTRSERRYRNTPRIADRSVVDMARAVARANGWL